MAAAVERLAQEALSLSDQERAELARELLVSLEGPPDEDVTDAWDREIAKRVDRVREGTAKGRPAEEVSGHSSTSRVKLLVIEEEAEAELAGSVAFFSCAR